MSLHPGPRRFTVDEYYRIGEAGILTKDDRVELIDGKIISMTPIGPRHALVVDNLTNLFAPVLRRRARIRVQNPVRLDDGSEPEPDMALLQPHRRGSPPSHPTPEDVLLLIEAADTSMDFDRGTKIPLYARHGIAEAWLVDLARETVTIYRNPAADGYHNIEVRQRGDQVSPASLTDLQLSVNEILD